MLQKLIDLFVGKRVRITHINKRVKTVEREGVCVGVHARDGGNFDIELEGEHFLGFVPGVVTSNSVEGELRAFAGGRRKIEVIQEA